MEKISAGGINYVIQKPVIWVGIDTYRRTHGICPQMFLDALREFGVTTKCFSRYFEEDQLFFNWFEYQNSSVLQKSIRNPFNN